MEGTIIATATFHVAQALEVAAIMIIGISFAHALLRAAFHLRRKLDDVYQRLRVHLGKALLLGLEFLVAADVIRSVVIDQTESNLYALGMLILIRIALGWSITVETEGCWPWQTAHRAKDETVKGPQ